MVVILKAVHSFAVFAATVNSLEVVTTNPPIVLNGIDIFNDLGVEIAVVLMRRWRLVDGFVFEQALTPEFTSTMSV